MHTAGIKKPFKPLLASYGGGHAQIIAALTHALIARGAEPYLVGFTTARDFFTKSGLNPNSILCMENPDTEVYSGIIPYLSSFLKDQQHPNILPRETEAYFKIGFFDLIREHGFPEARKLLDSHGRKAFKPVRAMEEFLTRTAPDCVVTTTSPRFEHALLKAARKLGIPSIAVSDLFLLNEREWILEGGYAEHLTVLNRQVADDLYNAGLRGTEIHITGNPAFDSLSPLPEDQEKRAKLRTQLEIGKNSKLILWPSPAVTSTPLYSKQLLSPSQVSAAFEELCADQPSFSYMLRPHPNAPYGLPTGAEKGFLDPGLSPRDALVISDIVCVELSTMGLQAALYGLPVICVGFAKEAIYPQYGLAKAASSIKEAIAILKAKAYSSPLRSGDMPEPGTATQAIVDLIYEIGTR
ncbi:hypothetical protein EGT29_04940 [Pigmentiphaga sp. H8]|uniref:hypothetical protein n=1 Tax=Pigmentiphaga sp. H8 TaxID=2488560 RepID=UPI000F5AEEB3|nr:hypothetical protein [Pigmentiphaga sp. H8]AZG07267.1 hypothetical protein EGT29_04940 [Pigmentiphaga sp. H8]